jgi:hypothetical protein
VDSSSNTPCPAFKSKNLKEMVELFNPRHFIETKTHHVYHWFKPSSSSDTDTKVPCIQCGQKCKPNLKNKTTFQSHILNKHKDTWQAVQKKHQEFQNINGLTTPKSHKQNQIDIRRSIGGVFTQTGLRKRIAQWVAADDQSFEVYY